jgi:hypothetical protein
MLMSIVLIWVINDVQSIDIMVDIAYGKFTVQFPKTGDFQGVHLREGNG